MLPKWVHNASGRCFMKTLTLKNVPEDTYDRIGKAAKANRRSLNRQAILWLEQASDREPEIDLEEELADLDEFRRALGFTALDAELTQAKNEGRP
jgi:antitoxin FitA